MSSAPKDTYLRDVAAGRQQPLDPKRLASKAAPSGLIATTDGSPQPIIRADASTFAAAQAGWVLDQLRSSSPLLNRTTDGSARTRTSPAGAPTTGGYPY